MNGATDTAVERTAYRYRTVRIRKNVLVDLSAPGDYTTWMKEFTPADGKPPVPGHWTHGVLAGGTFVNDHYYGVGKGDLGTKICATVKVIRKTRLKDGMVFVLRNIYRCEPDQTISFLVMKFKEDPGRGRGRHIRIPNTKLFLRFNRTDPPTE